MIKSIEIKQYRKLKDLDLKFTPGLNAISGSNGTCKTSLLHLVGNSFQAVTKKCTWVNDNKCLQIIKAVNSVTNPKVESLTRGDKQYNDPAHGVNGILFTVNYFDRDPLGFRRHNSLMATRFAVKPLYKPGSGDKLPYCPVIYLGLSRLVPFGEFQNDSALAGIKKSLPIPYQQEINELYKSFTHYSISYTATQQMGDLKTRAEFSSDKEGIDSNTISAGEDNLYVILAALVSLKYYYESISSTKTVESILLVDEIDATLHPAFQIKLLKLLREYSSNYKIQVIFTTHSMSTLEDMLDKNDNVVYLIDNITSAFLMEDPDIYKIKMHLSSLTNEDIYRDKVIPIFTEDDEARFLLNAMLDYFEATKGEEFRGVRRFLHMVQVNLGADSLTDIFKDSKLLRTTMSSICVLDGDHNFDIPNCITTLPGKNAGGSGSRKSPEELLFEYADILYEADDQFWTDRTIVDKGYGKAFYLDRIREPREQYDQQCRDAEVAGTSVSKKRRVFNKELFNKELTFFGLLFKNWLHNPGNQSEIERFYGQMKTLFHKTAQYNEINPNEWS